MRLYLAIIGPDKDQSPALALIGSHTGSKLVTIDRLLTIIWSPLHQLLPVAGVQAHGHVASQPRLQLRTHHTKKTGGQSSTGAKEEVIAVITMHHNVYLGCIDRW